MLIPPTLELVAADNPILYQPKYLDMPFDNIAEVYELAQKLYDAMIGWGGMGLAAPQVGIPYNIFVVGATVPRRTFINPLIHWSSVTKTMQTEGCLSFPGLLQRVLRPAEVTITYYTVDGAQMNKRFDGLNARVIQHEYDHLKGKTIGD